MSWANLAQQLPWLRGQAVHLAAQDTQQLITETAEATGFVVQTSVTGPITRPYCGIAGALALPATAEANLDALADSLGDLPSRWPGCDRLALLVPEAHVMVRADLLGWTQLWLVLERASAALWDEEQLVFETVFFVPAGWFGADAPA